MVFAGIGALIGGISAAESSKEQLGYVNGKWVVGGVLLGGGIGALFGWGVGTVAAAIGVSLTTGCSGTLGGIIYSDWQAAEQALRDASNGVRKVFDTQFGQRIVDSFSQEIIRESKYGYQSLTQFIRQEIAKDVWILNNTDVKAVEWHFYWSEISNSGGPSGPLFEELIKNGIDIIFH